mmetsp:Transcript_106807/g.297322  ORF Transcript_106807/g.297322 Transcript_106807/m.297322 type:complete len:282 (+) Transcript_106807:469-1314(+)
MQRRTLPSHRCKAQRHGFQPAGWTLTVSLSGSAGVAATATADAEFCAAMTALLQGCHRCRKRGQQQSQGWAWRWPPGRCWQRCAQLVQSMAWPPAKADAARVSAVVAPCRAQQPQLGTLVAVVLHLALRCLAAEEAAALPERNPSRRHCWRRHGSGRRNCPTGCWRLGDGRVAAGRLPAGWKAGPVLCGPPWPPWRVAALPPPDAPSRSPPHRCLPDCCRQQSAAAPANCCGWKRTSQCLCPRARPHRAPRAGPARPRHQLAHCRCLYHQLAAPRGPPSPK